jgi:hypothetical protein
VNSRHRCTLRLQKTEKPLHLTDNTSIQATEKMKKLVNHNENRKEIINLYGTVFSPLRQEVFMVNFLHFLLTRPESGGTSVREN